LENHKSCGRDKVGSFQGQRDDTVCTLLIIDTLITNNRFK